MNISEHFLCLCLIIETSIRQKKLNEALMHMIVKDLQPPRIVEDEGFKNFVSILDPRYTTTLKYLLFLSVKVYF